MRSHVKMISGIKTAASILAISAMVSLPQLAAAQANPVAPPTRDELTAPQLQTEQRRAPTLTIDGDLARGPCALDNPDLADINVTLSGVNFAGAEAVSNIDLSEAYENYLGRELPISVLCDIRAKATNMLAEAGYLAAVEIPEQRIVDGQAEFRVVLGRLTALRVRGDAGPSEQRLAAYLQRLVGQDVFNTNEAERYLLLADDIPGLDVRLSLRAAANGAPGDLIGEVAVLRRKATLDVNVQNLGSTALGRVGGLVRAEVYDITGLGDRTSLSVFSSADFTEQLTVQMGHDFLIGADGLRLGGQLTLGWTNPGLNLPNIDVESESVFASIYATYPLVREQDQSLYASFGLDLVDQDVDINDILLSKDRVRTIYAALDYETTDVDSIARRNGYTPYEPRLRTNFSIEVRKGIGILGASDDCRADFNACINADLAPSRIEQDPTPLLIRGSISGEFRPDPMFTIAWRLQGQYSDDPLPAFEEFSGGNYSIGRGYDPGTIAGDSGIGTSLELRYGSIVPDGPNEFAIQPYVFTDLATSWNRDPSQQPFGSDGLISVGGGVRFTHGKGIQGDLNVAVPLETTDFQLTRSDVRVLFSLTSRLLPWRF